MTDFEGRLRDSLRDRAADAPGVAGVAAGARRRLRKRRTAIAGAGVLAGMVIVAPFLLMDGEPGAWMRDVVHPDVELPAPPRIKSMLEKGQMVLDVLLKQGVPVAYTRAHITARVLTKRDRIGKALDIDDTLAALEIDHVTCTAEGAPVEHSTDIFLPRSLDLHVMRWLQDVPPVPAIGRQSRG